jgi:GNAT superfamily N-acetyltransferase
MYWRDRALEHGEPKKRAMRRLVESRSVPGLIAYSESSPVGWVSIAPRDEYPALLRSPQYRPKAEEENVWSIVCFTVDKDARGQGVRKALLVAALEHARANGAAAVEAYPHLVNRDDYMGHADLFRDHGFATVRETGKRAVVIFCISLQGNK